VLRLAYHGKVGEGGKGDDEGSDDVVETFLHWDGPGHTNKGDHGNDHKDKDNPVISVSIAVLAAQYHHKCCTYQRVLIPTSVASSFCGRVGMTVGTGATEVADAMAAETGSTIMIAVIYLFCNVRLRWKRGRKSTKGEQK